MRQALRGVRGRWGISVSGQPGPLPAPQAVSRGAADPASMAAAAPVPICLQRGDTQAPGEPASPDLCLCGFGSLPRWRPCWGMGDRGSGKACPLHSWSGHLADQIQSRSEDGQPRGARVGPEWRRRKEMGVSGPRASSLDCSGGLWTVSHVQLQGLGPRARQKIQG